MNHGSLFSGIGGFDLAAHWMGWNNVLNVERDPFCRQVLAHHFPKAHQYEDIKTFDATAYAGRVDIITGGFPCQPFSAAGQRKGTADDRYLWPQMFRIIREIGPKWVVAENVRGLLSWNDGLVLDTVCSDLEGEGYEVCPVVLPAAGVNAPHRRDRIWIVARHTDGGLIPRDGEKHTIQRQQNTDTVGICEEPLAYRPDSRREDRTEQLWRCETPSREGQPSPSRCGTRPNSADATNANGEMLEHRNRKGTPGRSAHAQKRTESPHGPRSWETFPTVAPVCGGDDGLPERLDGITFPKWRRESIKAYGNAIVPQVAYEIFKALHDE